MPEWFPTSLAIGLLIQAAALWLFLFLYNVVVCSLPRIWIKHHLKFIGGGLTVIVLPAVLILFRRASWLAPILEGRVFHWVHGATLLVLFCAVACQIPVSWRVLFPEKIPRLLSRRSARAPYRPHIRDWDVFRNPEFVRQPDPGKIPEGARAGAGLLPAYRRKIRPVRAHPLETRLLLSRPFRAINQTYDLHLVRLSIAFPNLPEAFDGLRVLQLADNHFGEVISPAWYPYVIGQAGCLAPDIIVLTGDFAADDHLYRQSIEILRPLRAPLGVWAIRGNHDFHTEPDIFAYWLEQEQIGLLSNRAVEFNRGSARLRVVGIEHPYRRVQNWRELMGAETEDPVFRIAITHTPDNIPRLARERADLVLAGHTHGGQWRLPVIGPLAYPSLYGRRFDRGLHQFGNTIAYCNPGFGVHTIPLRFRCPPEITLFELKRGEEKERARG